LYRENTCVNFTRDLLEAAVPADTALIEVARDGKRREWTFGEVAAKSAGMAGALAHRGVERGDVVMTLIGNRPEWVLTMLACLRVGAVVLPCTEQLRAKDLRLRTGVAKPKVIVADERNGKVLCEALEGMTHVEVVTVPNASLFDGSPAPAVETGPEDPCLITFTSGTTGEPRAVVHGGRYLGGQRVQAENWLGAKKGELVWCTASSGWSKSARNVFIAPWITGATALLHDARFDPEERLELIERERVAVLCMAPTEYRVIAKRAKLRRLPSLRGMVAAGEALNPEVLRAWEEATGQGIRDGYGQTETGQLTGMPIGEAPKPGSMGKALQGMRLTIEEGELVVDPTSVPTFFLGYLGEERPKGQWHTGDLVREDDEGYLYF
jgi:acyl-coenzyme A synthetase/AMP-(fatty) acid ligase